MKPFEIKSVLFKKTPTPREKIRYIAKKEKLSFADLARKSKIPVKTCQNFLEHSPINLSNYIKLLKALKINDKTIMGSLGFRNFTFIDGNHLGNYIEFLRKEQSLSKKELVGKISDLGHNISVVRYTNLVNGKFYYADVEMIHNISKILRPEKIKQTPYIFARRAITETKLSVVDLAKKSNTGVQTWYALYNQRNISLKKYLDIMHTLKYQDNCISFILGLPDNIKPNTKEIGRYLRTLRRSKGINADFIAKKVMIATVSYRLIESGKGNPSIITCYKAINAVQRITVKDNKHWIGKRWLMANSYK
ncbi:XRE family transcriptional regulator [Apilactobacillus timberlakei]|nr:XRE family transcriptional regulator [Apilactobacillus timberlakei]